FVANQLAISVNIARHRTMKFRSRTRPGAFILVGDALNGSRQSIRINRWRTAARARGHVVAQNRVITRMGRAPNHRSALRAFTLLLREAHLLSGRAFREGDSD